MTLKDGATVRQGVMASVVENLDWCIRNSLPDHSDTDNVHTCLKHVAANIGITCTDTINVRTSWFTSQRIYKNFLFA